MTEVITLEDVWKTYPMGEVTVNALKGVSLSIDKGDFAAILGPSGSGKSTMMNIVGCLDLPSKGVVSLEGQDIAKLHESQLAQTRGKKIGFIFQQFNLIPTLTALENVMLPLEFLEMDPVSARKKAKDLLELVGLGNRTGHLPSQLSGGQMQRVAIARALAVEPEIILADEPTGNLDSETGAFILSFLRKINKEGTTVVMVTHDLELAGKAEKIVYLKDGKIEKIEHKKHNRGAIK
ncbi:MAG: ABC transporter ATP-binding protein [Nanoarchaeota archaeon]